MIIDKMRRRFFLQGAGGFTLALPVLSSLLRGNEARGADSGAPLRFIAIKSYSTQKIVDWYPTFSGNGYELRDSGDKADGTTMLHQQLGSTPYHWAPLGDFAAPGVSTILTEALNPFLDRMLLLRGLDFLPTTNHNEGGMLGNFQASDDPAAQALTPVPTIDQVLAYSPKVYPSTPIARSLHLAPGGANTCSFTDGGVMGAAVEQVQGHQNPLSAWNQIFNAPGAVPPDPSDDFVANRNLKLVDRVYQDYTRLRNNPRLGAADRQTVDRHLTFLSELQDRLEHGGGGVECTWPDEPRSIDDPYGLDVMDMGDAYELMIDVLVAAIICDHTRIVTLDVRKALSDGRGNQMAGYYHGADNPSTWHGDAHAWGDAAAEYNIQRINHWIAHEIFLRLLERLDVAEDIGSTFLDNSIVMWGNELGFNHLNWSVPTLLAGGAGGRLDMGRYIDFIEWDTHRYFSQQGGHVIRGIPYNQFLVTILQAFGLEPAEYERNGTSGYGSIETVGKSANTHAIDYDFSQIGNPLPHVLT
jgi:hypothetical protein